MPKKNIGVGSAPRPPFSRLRGVPETELGAHLNVDPDDELITNVAVTAADTPDRDVIDELLAEPGTDQPATETGDLSADPEPATDEPAADTRAETDAGSGPDGDSATKDFEVYGDSAYADGATLEQQTRRGHDMHAKVPPVRNATMSRPMSTDVRLDRVVVDVCESGSPLESASSAAHG